MSDLQAFKNCIDMALAKIKEADISVQSKPDEIKTLFKKALSLKNPYWEYNNDCDRLTKLGLIFKPHQAYIQKGKPIYVGISFEERGIIIALEEQHARSSDNTFEVPYQLMLNSWNDFANMIYDIFSKAFDWANGIRQDFNE